MSGAGHGIFGDSLGRGEVAAEEVEILVSGCGHDDTRTVQASDRRHVRSQFTQDLRALKQSQVVEGVAENLDGHGAQRFHQTWRRGDPLGGPRRESPSRNPLLPDSP